MKNFKEIELEKGIVITNNNYDFPSSEIDYKVHPKGDNFGISIRKIKDFDGSPKPLEIGWYSTNTDLGEFRKFQKLINATDEFIRENDLS